MKIDEAALTKEREEAWIGDAVLALYVREWLLKNHLQLDGEAFIRFTSNDFLRLKGNPTSVEAEIGRIYQDHDLEKAFAWIEEHLLPRFLTREKQLAARDKKGRKKR
jgi:dsRNA-specific ribonuclease